MGPPVGRRARRVPEFFPRAWGVCVFFSRGSFSKSLFSFSKSGFRGSLYGFVRCAILVNAFFVLEKTFSDLQNAPRKFHGAQRHLIRRVGPDFSGDAIFGPSAKPGAKQPPGGEIWNEFARARLVAERGKDKTKHWDMPNATNPEEDERSTQQPFGPPLYTASAAFRKDARACIITCCG